MMVQCVECGANIQAGDNDAAEDIIEQWNEREILERAADINDDETLTNKEKAFMLYRLIKRYNKY